MVHKAALDRFLKRLLLRSDLRDDEQQQILSLPGEIKQLSAHRDIVRPGQQVEAACLVVEGLAARFDQMVNGRRQITALHIPGDMCDLHSVAAPVAGWGIEALTNTQFLLVPHDALRAAARAYPAIAMAFWRDTIVDGVVMGKWLSALGRRNAESRLAHFYCEMGCRFEKSGDGKRDNFMLRTTQSQLADILGISSVHVNRSLQALRGRGLVKAENFHCEILDWAGLKKMAEFDSAYLLFNEPDIDRASPATNVDIRLFA